MVSANKVSGVSLPGCVPIGFNPGAAHLTAGEKKDVENQFVQPHCETLLIASNTHTK